MPHSPRLLRPRQRAAAIPTEPPVDRDLSLWLDASVTTYEDDGLTILADDNLDRIGGWKDRTVNEWPMISSGDAKPRLHLNYATGIRAIYFGDMVEPSYMECNSFASSAAWSFAMVLIPVSYDVNQTLVQSADGGDKQIKMLDTGQFYIANDQSSIPTFNDMTTATVLTPNTAYIASGRASGSGLLRLNNAAEDTSLGGGTVGWAGLILGDSLIPAETAIAELLIWGAELTNAELTTAYQYLANKYNL